MSNLLPNPSLEQLDIINCADSNIVVNSVAGSGKTTTILHLSQAIYNRFPESKILLLTYNKKLKLETREKVRSLNINNLEVNSYHSFCCRYYKRSCSTDYHILDILESTHSETIPKYDYIIIDEAQDLVEMYFSLICMITRDIKRRFNEINHKFVIIGDSNQNIYEFKGATAQYIENASITFQNLTTNIKWSNYNLSMSYRINNQMCDFVNKVMLKQDRMRACKDGQKPDYIICNSWEDADNNSQLYDIVKEQMEKFRCEDIFIIAYSVKNKKSPVRKLANKLSDFGIPIFVPGSDEEKLDETILAGKLVFSSYHQTKGLERKCVIICGFDDYFYKQSVNTQQEVCPNILYVATTRATDKLVLVHFSTNNYLPFIDQSLIPIYCNYKDISTTRDRKESKKGTITEVSKMTDHKSPKIIRDAIRCFSHHIIVPKLTKISLSNIIDFNYGEKNDLIETVAEINGIATVSYFEYCYNQGKSLSILSDMSNNTMDYEYKGKFDKSLIKIDRAIEPFHNKLRYENTDLTHTDITSLSNIYCCYRSGFIHKLNHLPKCEWLTLEQYMNIFHIMRKQIGSNCLFEVILRSKIKINDKFISKCGRCDIFDLGTNTLWEIKTVSELKPEHIIQTAIYGYFLEASIRGMQYDILNTAENFKFSYTVDENEEKANNKLWTIYHNLRSNTTPLQYKLFNVLTNEIIEIKFDYIKMHEMMQILLSENKENTDDFINNIAALSHKYINTEMNTSCLIVPRRTYWSNDDDWDNCDVDDTDPNPDAIEEFYDISVDLLTELLDEQSLF